MKIGIIGCGNISGAYFGGAQKTNALEIKSCADINMEAARRAAEKYGCLAVSVDELLADPAVSIFIAEENREAIGYIFCKLIERPENPFTFAMRSLLVEHISVRPAARGKGVGTALMKQAEMLAKALAVQRIQLDSWDFNADAHSCFERLGFQRFNFRFWRPV